MGSIMGKCHTCQECVDVEPAELDSGEVVNLCWVCWDAFTAKKTRDMEDNEDADFQKHEVDLEAAGMKRRAGKCGECKGSGAVEVSECNSRSSCPICNGTGRGGV